jgi:hypothetical protein
MPEETKPQDPLHADAVALGKLFEDASTALENVLVSAKHHLVKFDRRFNDEKLWNIYEVLKDPKDSTGLEQFAARNQAIRELLDEFSYAAVSLRDLIMERAAKVVNEVTNAVEQLREEANDNAEEVRHQRQLKAARHHKKKPETAVPFSEVKKSLGLEPPPPASP